MLVYLFFPSQERSQLLLHSLGSRTGHFFYKEINTAHHDNATIYRHDMILDLIMV